MQEEFSESEISSYLKAVETFGEICGPENVYGVFNNISEEKTLFSGIKNFCREKNYETALVTIVSHAETVESKTKGKDDLPIKEILYLLSRSEDKNGKPLKEEKVSLHRTFETISSANPKLKNIITILEVCLDRKTLLLDYNKDKAFHLAIKDGVKIFTFSAAPVYKSSTSSYYSSYSRLLLDILEYANRQSRPETGFDIVQCSNMATQLLREDFEKRKNEKTVSNDELKKPNPDPKTWAGPYYEKKDIDSNLVLM